MRMAAAKATAEASSTAVAPAAQRGQQRVEAGGGSSASTVATSASRPLQPPPAAAPAASASAMPAKAPSSSAIRSTGFRQAFDLLHPMRWRSAATQRRQRRLGVLPAGEVERLERLVGEIERVADLDVAMVGDRREQHVGHARAWRRPRTAETTQRSAPSSSRTSMNRRNQRLSAAEVGAGRRQRVDREARRRAGRLDGHVGEAVVERARPVVGFQVRQQVHQAGVAWSGPGPSRRRVARAEPRPGPERLRPRVARDRAARSRPWPDQADVALQAILQPRALVRGLVGRRPRSIHTSRRAARPGSGAHRRRTGRRCRRSPGRSGRGASGRSGCSP